MTAPTARPVSHRFSCWTTSGRPGFPRPFSLQTWLVASGDVGAEERSGRSESSDVSEPPSSVRPVLSGLASTTKGSSDASGSGGSAGSCPEQVRILAQRAGFFVQLPWDSSASRGRSPKNTSDRKPPPESSSRTEQIREHRRHRCQSALGLRSWLVARPSIHPGRATLESACWSGVAVAGHPARSRCVWSRRIRRRRRPPP